MQRSMLFFTILFIGLQLRCAQADINFVLKSVNMEDVNPKYIDPDYSVLKIVDDDKGGVMVSSKLKIIKEYPKDAMYHFAILKYSMGAYQLPVGVVLTGNLCERANDTVLISQIAKMFGIRKKNCPPSVGTYENGHFYGKLDDLLDGLPSGKYKLIFRLYQGYETIFTLNGLVDLL